MPKEDEKDEVSSSLNPPIMLNTITPSEILIATYSSANTNTVQSKADSLPEILDIPIEQDARNQHVLFNSDVGNPEVEAKVVGDARSTQIDEYLGSLWGPPIMLNPISVDRSEILDILYEEDARNKHLLFNSDVGNPEVEAKVVGDTRSTRIPPIMLSPINPSYLLHIPVEQDARNQQLLFNKDVGDTELEVQVASSSENTNTVQSKAVSFILDTLKEKYARNQHVFNTNVGNPEVEVKAVGDARSTQIDGLGSLWDPPIKLNPKTPSESFMASSENTITLNEMVQRAQMYQAFADMAKRYKDALSTGEAEDKHKEIAVSGSQNLASLFEYPIPLIPSEFSMAASSSENTNTVDSETASLYETKDLLIEKDARNQDVLVDSELETAVSENKEKLLCSQEEEDQEQSAKDVSGSRKQSAKGPSSPSPCVLNSIDSSNEALRSSSSPSGEALVPQILAMQDKLNHLNELIDQHTELQQQMTELQQQMTMTKEAIEANNDALLQQEISKQVTGLIDKFVNQDLFPVMLEEIVRKELAEAVVPLVPANGAITPAIRSAISDCFQSGVGGKAVHQLEKSDISKHEATVTRQIPAQFQTSGLSLKNSSIGSSNIIMESKSTKSEPDVHPPYKGPGSSFLNFSFDIDSIKEAGFADCEEDEDP